MWLKFWTLLPQLLSSFSLESSVYQKSPENSLQSIITWKSPIHSFPEAFVSFIFGFWILNINIVLFTSQAGSWSICVLNLHIQWSTKIPNHCTPNLDLRVNHNYAMPPYSKSVFTPNSMMKLANAPVMYLPEVIIAILHRSVTTSTCLQGAISFQWLKTRLHVLSTFFLWVAPLIVLILCTKSTRALHF